MHPSLLLGIGTLDPIGFYFHPLTLVSYYLFCSTLKLFLNLFSRMSAPVSGRKTPVDHGVQIRFINDLHDTGGGGGGGGVRRETSGKSASRYGVEVRVQGIAGQPYVVLKNGQKGDSYGVQLRTPSYNSLTRYHRSHCTVSWSKCLSVGI